MISLFMGKTESWDYAIAGQQLISNLSVFAKFYQKKSLRFI